MPNCMRATSRFPRPRLAPSTQRSHRR
jgi:hypothetical protein